MNHENYSKTNQELKQAADQYDACKDKTTIAFTQATCHPTNENITSAMMLHNQKTMAMKRFLMARQSLEQLKQADKHEQQQKH